MTEELPPLVWRQEAIRLLNLERPAASLWSDEDHGERTRALCLKSADKAAAFSWAKWNRDFDQRMADFNASLDRTRAILDNQERMGL